MSKKPENQRNYVTEVTLPVGTDATFRPSEMDPLGMYTGNPQEPYEIPVQDADDL